MLFACSVTVPLLTWIPPPEVVALLPVTLTPARISVAELEIPPPLAFDCPPVMDRSRSVTVKPRSVVTTVPTAPPPWRIVAPAPAPSSVRLFGMTIRPV
jgi:hypothetical protein